MVDIITCIGIISTREIILLVGTINNCKYMSLSKVQVKCYISKIMECFLKNTNINLII